MTETHFFILLGFIVLLVVLQALLLLRKPKVETPPELNVRLGLLERATHGLVQSVSRNEGGMQRIEQQLRSFTEATAGAMAASKIALDEQLERTVAEARNGRAELSQAFQAFEFRLGQQVSELSRSTSERVAQLQRTTTDSLEASRKAVDERMRQTLDDARSGRIELTNAFAVFESKLEQRFASFDMSIGTRFDELRTALTQRLDASSQALMDLLTQAQTDAANARTEASQAITAFRTEITGHLGTVALETAKERLHNPVLTRLV